MDQRERLRALLVERSLFVGEFTLASGIRSSYYVDARRTTMSAEGQHLLGRVCLQAIRDAGWDAAWVGGMTLGADPVSYAIAHASWGTPHPLDGFTVRKQAKAHGRGQRIEGGLPVGARCVVVEDAMTSGGSALDAVHAVREHGAEPVGVLTVVDRVEGGREKIAEASGLPVLAIFTARELLDAAGQPAT